MSKYKKQRKVHLVRDHFKDNLPKNHFENYRINTLHYYKGEITDYYNCIGVHQKMMLASNFSEPITTELDKQSLLNNLNIFYTRSMLIQGSAILDNFLYQIIDQYQMRVLNREGYAKKSFVRVKDALDDCIAFESLTALLREEILKMRFYRSLRNQFAHYQYGEFYLSNSESEYSRRFRDFLMELEGVELGDSREIILDSDIGTIISYQFLSNEFLQTFITESANFLDLFMREIFPKQD